MLARPVLASLLLLLGCGAGGSDRPGGDPAAVATSLGGRYRIGVRPADPPVVLGALHAWIVRIEREDGAAARPTTVRFDGGMPSHGHGFVTAPRVTRELGDGEYLVEGVKFHMAGAWELRVGLTDAEGADGASFAITVAP